MKSQIRSAHRFLVSQSLYPLLLTSLLAGAFFIMRVAYSRRLDYSNLVWNLFLAWIPYGCSLVAAVWFRLAPRYWFLLLIPSGLWLVFFPNAPYIVTDFYHLGYRPPIPLWYDIGLIAIFAFNGVFLAIASLRTMHNIVKHYLGWISGWIFAGIALGLSALGIYLGRFGRFNSWDLLFHPKAVLKEIAFPLINPFENLGFVGFTLMFTAILVVFYLMFMNNARQDDAG